MNTTLAKFMSLAITVGLIVILLYDKLFVLLKGISDKVADYIGTTGVILYFPWDYFL